MAYDEVTVSITAHADTNGTVTVEAPEGTEWDRATIKALAQEAVSSLHGSLHFKVGPQTSYLSADRTRAEVQQWAFRVVPRG